MAMVKLWAHRVPGFKRLGPVCGLLFIFIITALGLATQLPYDTEYEVMEYSTRVPTDPVARLQQKIDSGEVKLQFDAKSGYLNSLLRHLGIPVASQILVFSKTSFPNQPHLPADAPRHLFWRRRLYRMVKGWSGGRGFRSRSTVGSCFLYAQPDQERGPSL